jgi:outer membrane receptor for ferrienterochelin and colicins
MSSDATQDEARLEVRLTKPLLAQQPWAEELSASAGGVLSRQQAKRINGDGDDTLPGGGERDVLSLYAEALWRPTTWISLSPGARADVVAQGTSGDDDKGPDGAFGPKISARVDGPAGTAVRASFGRGFRLPSFEERFLRFDHSELGYVVNGNPDLAPEVSSGYRAEALWDPLDEVSLGAELYGNFIGNLIDVKAVGDVDGVPLFSYANRARAYTSGLNLRAGIGPFAGLRLDVTYQYLINAIDASACPSSNEWFCSAAEGAVSLPLRPAHSLDSTLRWRIDATGTTLFFRGDAMSERILDANTSGPGSVILAAGVRQSLFETGEFMVGLENLLDTYDPTFGPKPGRHVSVSLRVWQ